MSNRDKHLDTGFETPEGYFDHLADRLIKKSIESTDQKASAGFQVPDGYFKKLNDRVAHSVQSSSLKHGDEQLNNDPIVIQLDTEDRRNSSEGSSQSQKKSVRKLLSLYALPIVGAAAAVVALFMINGIGDSSPDTDLSAEALSTYVYNLDDYLDPETVDILYDEAIVLDDIDTSMDIDDAALMDYLVNEMDMNQILSE